MSTLARGLLLVALLGSTLVLAGQAASTTVQLYPGVAKGSESWPRLC